MSSAPSCGGAPPLGVLDIPAYAQMWKQACILKDQPDATVVWADARFGAGIFDHATIEFDTTAFETVQSRYRRQQHGLARA